MREDRLTRLYRWVMGGLLHQPLLRWGFLLGVVVLLLGSMALVYIGFVKVKMLPFDNKSEFQVIVDMPNGTTLEETARVTKLLAEQTLRQPEVVNLQTYVGTASPYNFNGLVRHYYMRSGSNIADIQVNLQPKGERNRQSHEIAKMVRTALQPIADRNGARIKVAEVPPGPPVLETLSRRSIRPQRDPSASPSRARSAICSAKPMAWWIPTGTSKTTSRKSNSAWTKRKPRCMASPRIKWRARCGSLPRANRRDCCMSIPKKKTSPSRSG